MRSVTCEERVAKYTAIKLSPTNTYSKKWSSSSINLPTTGCMLTKMGKEIQ